jgi:agmatinase
MNLKEDAIRGFDPNGPGIKGNLFGLPFTYGQSEIVLIPIPWEVTVSYRTGTALGPDAILMASQQIDLYSKDLRDIWKLGVSMLPIPHDMLTESTRLRKLSSRHIQNVESNQADDSSRIILQKINEACESLNIYINKTTRQLLEDEKLTGLIGGDHSIALGFIKTLAEKHQRFGILQIDAHADLRRAYEGFTYSHGSVMYNALKFSAVSRLVQVGIRDFCEEESAYMESSGSRIKTFFDQDMKEEMYLGKTWADICSDIINQLPELVYVSFDIDGLDPKLCPHTGTPVPGGLEFQQAVFLIKQLVLSGRKIIGFDLSEVAPGSDDWDANVGARIAWELTNWMGVSWKANRA